MPTTKVVPGLGGTGRGSVRYVNRLHYRISVSRSQYLDQYLDLGVRLGTVMAELSGLTMGAHWLIGAVESREAT